MTTKPNALLIGEFLNHFNRNLLQDHYECSYVRTAEEALNVLSDKTFFVLISDFRLPDLNGDSLHDSLRLRGDHTPIIFLTKKEDLTDVEKMKICCGGHLVVPCRNRFILKILSEAGSRVHDRDCV